MVPPAFLLLLLPFVSPFTIVSSPSIVLGTSLNMATTTTTTTTTTTAEAAIRQLLSTYETSLNTSNATLAASCYTANGVFMPTTLPTAVGTQDLQASYAAIFENIQLNVKFTIDELVVTSNDSAYALTQSAGHVTVKATGDQPAEANREVFIFAKNDQKEWKIARYMFNKSS